MPAISKILVPLDFSEGSEHALAYAVDLARSLHATIAIMTACEYPVYSFPDAAIIATAQLDARLVETSQRALDAAARRLKESGVNVEKVPLREGPPWEEIVDVAKQTNADLIVMGSHGRRGFARAFLGSVAERVVRTAPRPVLVIRHPHDR